jgi:hypothetical protein
MINSRRQYATCRSTIVAAAVLALQVPAVLAQSVNGHGEDVTFNRDVMSILQAKCQECHQPNSIAPMSFLAYRDAYRRG